jgi:hypothetical protein
MVISSLKVIIPYRKAIRKTANPTEYRNRFYNNGSYPRNIRFGFNWENVRPVISYYDNRNDENISDIKKIIDLCDKYNITLIVFTNPLHIITYRWAVMNGYLDFLHKLSDITEYYNFSGINDITTNNAYYEDTSHYKIEVGDMIIDAVFNGTVDDRLLQQGFGYHVTRESRDKFFNIIDKQKEEENAF